MTVCRHCREGGCVLIKQIYLVKKTTHGPIDDNWTTGFLQHTIMSIKIAGEEEDFVLHLVQNEIEMSYPNKLRLLWIVNGFN